MIVAAGLSKTRGAPEARRVIHDGFRRGRRAVWLPALRWESLLTLPLTDVRRMLRIDGTPDYTPVRAAEVNSVAMHA